MQSYLFLFERYWRVVQLIVHNTADEARYGEFNGVVWIRTPFPHSVCLPSCSNKGTLLPVHEPREQCSLSHHIVLSGGGVKVVPRVLVLRSCCFMMLMLLHR